MRYILLAIFFCSLSCQTTAQLGKKEYSTENKKAIKLFEEATSALNRKEYGVAKEYLESAIEKDENFTDAYIVLAELYMAQGMLNNAKKPLEKAISIEPKKFTTAYFYLGEIYISNGNYEEGIKNLKLYQSTNPPKSMTSDRAKRSLRNCHFAIEALKNPVNFEPVNFGPTVNTAYPEYYPTLTLNEQELLFTRRIENGEAHNGVHEDFFVTNKDNDSWGESRNMKRVNTLMNEGAPSYSADGKLLFFTACKLFDDYGAGRTGYGSCDIFYTYKKGKDWTQAMNLGGDVNTGVWESQPSFSADGKTLYFVRGKRSGTGISHQDIWSTELVNGKWKKPEKIPGLVNTPQTEESVFIHPDGETLYFASDGHPGMGGLDLFMSKKNPDGSWGEPVNLGYPINTQGDENSLLVSSSGALAVFASDRPGGFGDLDLYHFELPDNVKPQPVTYAQGLIHDAKNFRPLEAAFELIDLETGASIAIGSSDAISGEFLIPLPTGKEYMVNVSRQGYLFHSENFQLSSVASVEAYELNIPLKKISSGNSVVLENVFFDTDSYELKETSKLELGKLASFMKMNPELGIEIGGHTDNVGSDSDNLALSEKRAQSVMNYILELGIENERISAKGYGETNPMESNETEDGRATNRRTEFMVK